MDGLRKMWESRSLRDRMVIAALVAIVAVVLYAWLIDSTHRARLKLGTTVTRLRAEAIRLERNADEIARLRAAPSAAQPSGAQAELRVLMQAQVDAAGLGRSLLRIEPIDTTQVRLVFAAVPFADWLAWVENARLQQVRLDAARIETLATPGMVNVTATFVRPKP